MRDFRMHLDYIHLNPVKHDLVERVADWPWSSFRRYAEMGWYDHDWHGRADLPGSVERFRPE
jgi:putative transposase